MHAEVAVSTHPVAAIATGEAAGQLLERGFDAPDLLCCFVTSAHGGALEDIAAALQIVLSPATLLGAASAAVVANGALVDRGPCLALWAANVGPSQGLRLSPGARLSPDARLPLDAHPSLEREGAVPPDASGLILLADPAAATGEGFGHFLTGARHDLEIAGTLVTPARAAGGSLFTLNGELHHGGAVGVALGRAGGFSATLSPGTRPIGPELEVTSAAGPIIYELDALPARLRLERLARDELPATDIAFINDGLLLRVAGGAAGRTYPVAGADSTNGAIALSTPATLGTPALADELSRDFWEVHPRRVVQFQVHDRSAEMGDLRQILTQPQLGAALVFPSAAAPLASRPSVRIGAPGSAPITGCQGDAALGWLDGARGVHPRAAAVACFYDEGCHPGNGWVAAR